MSGKRTAQDRRLELLPPLAALLSITFVWRIFSRLQDGTPLGGFDERAYFRFAEAFRAGGLDALRALLVKYPTDPVLSLGPLPLRILYVLASAVAFDLGGASHDSMSWISTLSGLVTVVLAWRLFRLWYGEGAAWVGALLVAFASLETGLARRSLQDSFFTMWLIAMVYFFERTVTERRRFDPWLLGVVALCALLTKELAAFVYPVLAVAGWNRNLRRAVLPLGLAAVGSALVLVWIAGSPSLLISTYRAYAHLSVGNDYMRYQEGEWFRYFIDLSFLSPVTVCLVLASVLLPEPGHRRALLYGAASFVMFSALESKSVRYVAFLDVLMRGPAAAFIVSCSAGRTRWRTAVAAVLLLACIGTEVRQFQVIFVADKTYDPVTANLVRACGMEP